MSLSLNAAETSVPPSTELTELPAFVVEEKLLVKPRQSWRYGTAPDVEILSSTSSRNTQVFAEDFLHYRRVMGALFPLLGSSQDEMPLTLVLCDREKDFDAFVGSPAGVVDPGHVLNEKAVTGASFLSRSVYRKDAERLAFVVEMVPSQDLRIEDVNNEWDEPRARFGNDPFTVIKRQYFRVHLERGGGTKTPPWLLEGMLRLAATAEIRDNSIWFGRLRDHEIEHRQLSFRTFFGGGEIISAGTEPPQQSQQNFVRADFLARAQRTGPSKIRPLLPMAKLFSTPPEDSASLDLITWQMQSYAFVHLCLFDTRERYQKGFFSFIRRAANEPVTEKLFSECFGKSYAEMATTLRSYVDFTSYEMRQFKLKDGAKFPKMSQIEFRDATDAETGRLIGDSLRMSGQTEAARLSLIAPYVRGERDPELLAALGLLELETGQTDRARKFLEKAYAGKTKRVLALIELARLRLADALKQPAAENGQLGDSQMVKILSPLFEARKHKPAMAELYVLIASAWRNAGTKAAQAQLEVLDEGVILFPRNTALLLATSEAYRAHGFLEKTALMASIGEVGAKDEAARRRFSELQSISLR